MNRRRKSWQHPLNLVVLTAAAMVAAAAMVQHFEQRTAAEQLAELLLVEARIMEIALRADGTLAEAQRLAELLLEAGIETVVMDTSGQVRLQTGRPTREADLLTRPEVQATMRDGARTARQRYRDADGRLQMHLALRATAADGSSNGLIRLSKADAPPSMARALLLSVLLTGLIGVAAAPILLLLWRRLRRRVLLEAVQALRNLPLEEPPTTEAGGRYQASDLLETATNSLRRQLAARIERLQHQQRVCRWLIDKLSEGVIVADRTGHVVLLNPAAARLLDLRSSAGSVESFVGRPVEAVIPHYAIQKLLLNSGCAERTREVEPPAAEQDVTVETDTGSLHVRARAVDIELLDGGQGGVGAATGRAVLLCDVTEMRRIAQIRTDFVANASHELRTPLATIRAAVETLLTIDLASEAPAARMFLEKLDRHSARLQQMVTDLLDLSRLETPAERFAPEPIECRYLLEDLHLRFADELERKGLHWETRCEPSPAAKLHANPHLLRMTLDNLVDNAIKFTDPGGHVSVRLRLTPNAAVLEVADDGCGIPEEDQQRVFERFYQVHRARSGVTDRGTGLGLAIVRHAVGAMQGSVSLESTLGKGTRITVTIPQAAA